MKRPASPLEKTGQFCCAPSLSITSDTLIELTNLVEALREKLANAGLNSVSQEIEMLKDKVAGIKTTLRALEDTIQRGVEEMDSKAAQDVKLLYPVMVDHTKEITLVKLKLDSLQAQVEDIQDEATREYQHTRALEIVVQKLIDASPAHSHIDVRFEIENFSDERYHYHQVHLQDPISVEAPVSDPTLGS
ncbi:uncharacterized protein MELLADRAFT_68320 [Melampsora larici-populina 98AG31]|uniref:Uncharacterized protein n=1 Tax=Melampsora larici-populina (strain 98AG31 / pathotype 3-4-7) TaxID=747676 RepID=F4S6C9_MELLP|nr:uncharacterized protein MELLADRAFT_68320 [Melampsora larici-populina 98AG31]EGF99789.1 hypothetical protein MELLADRAFT_68320 [Melampsora larici-populina 98AG31]